jgi:hypothetical protein
MAGGGLHTLPIIHMALGGGRLMAKRRAKCVRFLYMSLGLAVVCCEAYRRSGLESRQKRR